MEASFGYLPEEEQAEIARRRLICAECPFNSKNAEGYETHRIDEHCIMCGCTISRKTASLSSECGIGCCNPDSDCDCMKPNLKKYNKEHNVIMETRWKVYKTEKDEQQTENSN